MSEIRIEIGSSTCNQGGGVECLADMATRLSASPDAPLGSTVETAAPRVTLRNYFSHPFDSAIAAARTCYSPRLIGAEEITDKQRVTIGSATYYGGHHTVYQHAHFEFGLENISRQFVWSFLHAHPFYNSEQQSQRYVRLDRAQAYVPASSLFFDEKSKEIYEAAIARAWNYYRELSSLLIADARTILNDIWHIGPDEKAVPAARPGSKAVTPAQPDAPVLNGEAIPVAELGQ